MEPVNQLRFFWTARRARRARQSCLDMGVVQAVAFPDILDSRSCLPYFCFDRNVVLCVRSSPAAAANTSSIPFVVLNDCCWLQDFSPQAGGRASATPASNLPGEFASCRDLVPSRPGGRWLPDSRDAYWHDPRHLQLYLLNLRSP